MYRFIILTVLLSSTLLGKGKLPRLEKLLPKKPLTANIIGKDSELYKHPLVKKFYQAKEKRRKWYYRHLKRYAGTYPIPYHRKFGLTKQEYKEYLKLTKPKSIGTLKVSLAKDPLGIKITFSDINYLNPDKASSSQLKSCSVIINPSKKNVYFQMFTKRKTKWVKRKYTTYTNQNDLQTYGRGALHCYYWSMNKGNYDEGANYQSQYFMLGQYADSGKRYMYLSISSKVKKKYQYLRVGPIEYK